MKIRNRKYSNPEQKEQYIVSECDDFEYKNPLNQIKNMRIASSIFLEREILKAGGFNISESTTKILYERAINEWQEELNELRSTEVHENMMTLLETEKKNKQKQLLKGISLTGEELLAFIIKAYELHGYTYSQYRASHHHEGLDETLLPAVIQVDDRGIVNTIGKTEMTEGQLKHTVEYRKETVAKFLDKDDKWHCFFLTFKSLKGKENYKNGLPHLHYISSAWGIKRECVKERLASKKYSFPSLPHIDFHTHRNPREK